MQQTDLSVLQYPGYIHNMITNSSINVEAFKNKNGCRSKQSERSTCIFENETLFFISSTTWWNIH